LDGFQFVEEELPWAVNGIVVETKTGVVISSPGMLEGNKHSVSVHANPQSRPYRTWSDTILPGRGTTALVMTALLSRRSRRFRVSKQLPSLAAQNPPLTAWILSRSRFTVPSALNKIKATLLLLLLMLPPNQGQQCHVYHVESTIGTTDYSIRVV
jgi:hypothetical protein